MGACVVLQRSAPFQALKYHAILTIRNNASTYGNQIITEIPLDILK